MSSAPTSTHFFSSPKQTCLSESVSNKRYISIFSFCSKAHRVATALMCTTSAVDSTPSLHEALQHCRHSCWRCTHCFVTSLPAPFLKDQVSNSPQRKPQSLDSLNDRRHNFQVRLLLRVGSLHRDIATNPSCVSRHDPFHLGFLQGRSASGLLFYLLKRYPASRKNVARL